MGFEDGVGVKVELVLVFSDKCSSFSRHSAWSLGHQAGKPMGQ